MQQQKRCRLIKQLACLSEEYFRDFGSPLPEEGAEAVVRDWWLALKFWFNCSFFRGRRDELSEKFRDRTLKVLTDVLGDGNRPDVAKLRKEVSTGAFNWREQSDTVAPVLSALAEDGVTNSYDRQMVGDTLVFVSQLEDLNIVRWAIREIKQGRIAGAYGTLNGIRWVAHKIARLFLAQVVHVYDLRKQCEGLEEYLFPLDTWVETICRKMELCPQKTSSALKESRELVQACKECGVDPMDFNRGCWCLGSHSLDIAWDLLTKDAK